MDDVNVDVCLSSVALRNRVAAAVWPWVRDKRWCPRDAAGDATAAARPAGGFIPRALFWLPAGRDREYDGEILVWILLLETAGELLQVPLVAAYPYSDRAEQWVGTNAEFIVPFEDDEGELGEAPTWMLFDGTSSIAYWRAWAERATVVGGDREGLLTAASRVRPLGVEQSNTSVLLEGGSVPLIAKVFRVLHPGRHPEVEIPGVLTAARWAGVPALWASWDLPGLEDGNAPGGPLCSAVVSTAIQDASDGFDLFVDLAAAGADPAESAFALGRLTAEMHHLLAQGLPTAPALAAGDLATRTRSSLAELETDIPALYAGTPLHAALDHRIGLFQSAFEDADRPASRIHGDLHLGQTLRDAQGSWFILDFEGEPLRPIDQRSQPDEPLRDVAGMLRSFDYAWSKAHEDDGLGVQTAWTQAASRAYLAGYESVQPLNETALDLLNLLQIEKALYEVAYESRFRPHYLKVPLAALEVLSQPPLQTAPHERL